MDDGPTPTTLSAAAAAQLLGYSSDVLERLRRERKVRAEPFRRRWWHLFPEYRYSEQALLDYYRGDARPDIEGASPLVRIANAIMSGAVDCEASDIHFEPDRKNVRVRYRIHGILHEVMAIPSHIALPLLHRYLLLAGVANPFDIAAAHTGVILIKIHNRNYDLRLSSIPNRYGAKLVMRLVASPAPTRWEELGCQSHSPRRRRTWCEKRLRG